MMLSSFALRSPLDRAANTSKGLQNDSSHRWATHGYSLSQFKHEGGQKRCGGALLDVKRWEASRQRVHFGIHDESLDELPILSDRIRSRQGVSMSDSGVPTSPLAAEDPDQVRMMEELCILVDDCDVVQGSCSKKDCTLAMRLELGCVCGS